MVYSFFHSRDHMWIVICQYVNDSEKKLRQEWFVGYIFSGSTGSVSALYFYPFFFQLMAIAENALQVVMAIEKQALVQILLNQMAVTFREDFQNHTDDGEEDPVSTLHCSCNAVRSNDKERMCCERLVRKAGSVFQAVFLPPSHAILRQTIKQISEKMSFWSSGWNVLAVSGWTFFGHAFFGLQSCCTVAMVFAKVWWCKGVGKLTAV